MEFIIPADQVPIIQGVGVATMFAGFGTAIAGRVLRAPRYRDRESDRLGFKLEVAGIALLVTGFVFAVPIPLIFGAN